MRPGERWCSTCGEVVNDPQVKRCPVCGQGTLVLAAAILPKGSYYVTN